MCNVSGIILRAGALRVVFPSHSSKFEFTYTYTYIAHCLYLLKGSFTKMRAFDGGDMNSWEKLDMVYLKKNKMFFLDEPLVGLCFLENNITRCSVMREGGVVLYQCSLVMG
jgi:hypothetical protein